MGRQAKYLTLSERTAAATISKQRYNGTERYVIAILSIARLLNLDNRGRTHRSSQNSKMYQRNHPFFAIPTLPETLLTHSKAFLRRTPLFDLYHKVIDTDPFEMDLRDYTHLLLPMDNKSLQSRLDLLHSINGRQLNRLEVEGQRRYEESVGARRFREITEAARDDLSHMLDSWRRVESSFSPEDDTNASMVHLLSLEWGARVVVDLCTELEVRAKGLARYRSEYQGQRLWWQKVMKY